eukprot:TRINITY_DN5043_c0_g1_i3.p1 TRINITY_DN5043_c0_g1~~TRINITY_DN5043_c0_g1_i3.p1  ORF type:complete len:606 (+),score=134.94 TRINITY_DN5043_c0_g1_i3:726-2543(+)
MNQVKSAWTTLFSTRGVREKTIKSNYEAITGTKADQSLEHVSFENDIFSMEALLTARLQSGSVQKGPSRDKILFFLNRRPIVPPKNFTQFLTKVYRQYNDGARFVSIIVLEMRPDLYDVNVTPDKRTVIFKEEGKLFERFSGFLTQFLEGQQSQAKEFDPAKIGRSQTTLGFIPAGGSSQMEEQSPLGKKSKTTDLSSEVADLRPATKRSKPNTFESKSASSSQGNSQKETAMVEEVQPTPAPAPAPAPTSASAELLGSRITQKFKQFLAKPKVEVIVGTQTSNAKPFASTLSQRQKDFHSISFLSSQPAKPISEETDRESEEVTEKGSKNLQIKRLQIPQKDSREKDESSSVKSTPRAQHQEKDLVLGGNDSEEILLPNAEEERRSFVQGDFSQLTIIGQFNLGFIIALTKDKGEVFVVDQHAADEKFNYERLIRTTVLSNQPLLCPLRADVCHLDKMIVQENDTIFEKNGFKLQWRTTTDGVAELYLLSLPHSKNVQFTVEDFEELIRLLRENPFEKDSVMISKAKMMFASRACRSSVMVGHPLDFPTMRKILTNLDTLKSPWNCPHGRPTLIKLRSGLRSNPLQRPKTSQGFDFSEFSMSSN